MEWEIEKEPELKYTSSGGLKYSDRILLKNQYGNVCIGRKFQRNSDDGFGMITYYENDCNQEIIVEAWQKLPE